MLNGQRQLWTTTVEYNYQDHKTVGKYYHRVCPQYKNLSAITNNGFVGMGWFLLAPAIMLLAAGVLAIIYLTWLLSIAFFIGALVPHAWLLNRYFNSTPHKWEEGSKVNRAENAYLLMPKDKQQEYRHFIDAVFRGNLSAVKAKELFDQCSMLDDINSQLTAEIDRKKQEQAILKELNGANFEST